MDEQELHNTDARPPVFKSALESGLLISAVLIIYSMALYLMDLHLEKWLENIAVVILIIALYFAGNNYRKKGDRAALSYGKTFKFLFLTLLVASFVGGIFYFIYFSWVSPESVEYAQVQAYEELIDQGMSPEQAEKQMEVLIPWVMTPHSLAIIACLLYLFWGTIASLIMAAMLKRDTSSI